MRVSFKGIGRQSWLRYCAVKLSGSPLPSSLRASFSAGNLNLSVPVFPAEPEGGAPGIWVIAFPCLFLDRQSLSLADETGATIWSKSFTPRAFQLYNSITCRLDKRLTSLMHSIEEDPGRNAITLHLTDVCPFDGDHEVLRIDMGFPPGIVPEHVDARKCLADGPTQEALVLHEGVEDDGRYHAVLSYRVRKDGAGTLIHAESCEGCQPGILYISPELRGAGVRRFADFTQDAAGNEGYAAWFASQRRSEEELGRQRSASLSSSPLLSIVMPIYNPPLTYLEESIGSIRAQTYANWELIAVNASPEDKEASAALASMAEAEPRIKVVGLEQNLGIVGNTNTGIRAASGDYIAFVDQDDMLEPDALFEYASAICEHPEASLLYCDEDSFTDGIESVFYPRFKPKFNKDALLSHNYVIHMLAVSRKAIDAVELSGEEVEGAQDYDLTLKAIEHGPAIHIPRVLYHWRNHERSINYGGPNSKPYVTDAAVNALRGYFERTGCRAEVSPGMRPGTHRVLFQAEDEPLVSVIIPTKDHPELLGACVKSLLERAGWANLEILLVENNSVEERTFAFYDELLALDGRIRLLRYEGAFNYSRIINYAAAQANGELLFLLNNDTQAITDGCIRILAGYFQRPEVGVVGPLLLFPDGLVQTAGLALMSDKRLGFINQLLTPETHGGYLASLDCPRNYSAVLGAAQMVRKADFEALGGYDEDLAVTYNDADFCWRMREAGKIVVYTPHARLYHHEFATRSRDTASPEQAARTEREAALMQARWKSYFEDGDPEMNPECDQANPWFKLPRG